MEKPKYFQLEPNAFLSDISFQTMTAQERGIYFTMLLYLYANGGAIRATIPTLQTLCGYSADSLTWEQIWNNIKHKFEVDADGQISHKGIAEDIQTTINRMQVARNAGLKGAKKRWGKDSNPNGNPIGGPDGVAIAKKTKAKKRKENSTKTVSKEFSDKDLALAKIKAGIRFAEAVDRICESKLFTPSERTCWHAYRKHLAGLGTDWLDKGTAKLRELTGWRDSKPERNTTDLKKAFGGWMVRAAKYKKKEIT